MTSHPELVSAFREGLRTGVLPVGATARNAEEVARRFDVYRNNVAHGLSEALGRRFPVVERLVGGAFFRALALAFLETHPPRSPVLLAWGEAFPGFLAAFPPVAGLPYLPDVARLELARGRAYHAADLPALGPEDLARAATDPEAARLALHPSVSVIASRFAVVSVWRANQPGASAGALDPARPETALILRDSALEVPVRAIGPGDAALLGALAEGAPLLAAAARALRAEPRHDPAPLLAALAAAGALLAPDPETLP